MKDIIRMNQLAGLITEGQARKMMEILNEAEDTLEQDLLDFWDTLQDDAAQSDGEYKASWDTDFFLEMYKEYKGREAEVRNAVKQLKQQGKLSLYGKREKGVEGTGSVLDFTKQNIKEIAEVISKKHGFGTILPNFKDVLKKPNEFIGGNADLAEIYYTRQIYDTKDIKLKNGFMSKAIPTGTYEKALYIKIAFDKDKITKNKSTGFSKFVVKGTTIYTSPF